MSLKHRTTKFVPLVSFVSFMTRFTPDVCLISTIVNTLLISMTIYLHTSLPNMVFHRALVLDPFHYSYLSTKMNIFSRYPSTHYHMICWLSPTIHNLFKDPQSSLYWTHNENLKKNWFSLNPYSLNISIIAILLFSPNTNLTSNHQSSSSYIH